MAKKSKIFNFKQFSIKQDKAAMKVGTDGVLLGAWCSVEDKFQVLDIGTGTGLIALMIAQRNKKAQITAIDIDKAAVTQANENFKSSIWSDRLTALKVDLNDFKPSHKFDLIVCNPPFFKSNTSISDKSRKIARQAEYLTLDDLMCFSNKYLSENGQIAIVYPSNDFLNKVTFSTNYQLIMSKLCYIYPNSFSSVPKRVLLEYSKMKASLKNVVADKLTIEHKRHEYTKDYVSLTQDFYTIF